jgi:hypothetical protein
VEALERGSGFGMLSHLAVQAVEQRLDAALERHHPGDAPL